MWVLVDGNLNLNYEITTLYKMECQFLYVCIPLLLTFLNRIHKLISTFRRLQPQAFGCFE